MNDLPDEMSLDDSIMQNLLEEYLARLQAGETSNRDVLAAAYPELASSLHCLEALEAMAPSANGRGAVQDDQASALAHVVAAMDVRPSGDFPSGDSSSDAFPVDRDDLPSGNASFGALPRRFGQYMLLNEIGRGGMGVVYRARQDSLDRTVAVKMILAAHLASSEHVRRFQTEARAAARLRHPHIVPIHEVGRIDGQDYFAMEYVEGESLAERLAQGPIDVKTALRIVAAIAHATDHLHHEGIVHRDLKPSNILLDVNGQPYLTDFGLAKVFSLDSEATATGVITGTPSYMAPEQASGSRSEIGPAVDIYSLGAILYELLTGRPPFREDNPLDTLVDVLSREPTLPRQLNPHVPRELEWICLKCLAKTPSERYRSAAALADDLERFARGEALEVQPPHLGQKLWSWGRRQPALASRFFGLGILYGAFALIEGSKYLAGWPPAPWTYHFQILTILAIWMTVSVICQQFLESRRWAVPARFVWGTLDSLLLLAVLLLADGVASPLVAGYALLIVAAGLWFRVRFVAYITFLSILSYAILVCDFYVNRSPEFRAAFDTDPDRHVISILVLLLLGGFVAYLVHRVRLLSTFYGHRMQ